MFLGIRAVFGEGKLIFVQLALLKQHFHFFGDLLQSAHSIFHGCESLI